MIRPPRLRAADTVALIAPASPPSGPRMIALGKKRLEQLGLRVVVGKHARAERGYLAGTDRERLHDLEAAFRDPRVKAIFCARGGYGVGRILARQKAADTGLKPRPTSDRVPQMTKATAVAASQGRRTTAFDPSLARRFPKAVVGFSDITMLHLALQAVGVVSFWGPMPCTGLGWSAFSVRQLQRVLMSSEPVGRVPSSARRRPSTLRGGVARGPLTGGTLSLLAASLGTPLEVDTRGRIVFLEDVDEEPYRVDRMLTQLLAAGKLADAAGIALGIFTGTKVRHSPGRRSLTLGDAFADHLLPLKIPLLAGLAVGHVRDQLTLPYGVEAQMDAGKGTVEILEAGVE